MAIDWLDNDGNVPSDADNPVKTDYFENVTPDVAVTPPVPGMEEMLLQFEGLNCSFEELDQIIDLAYRLDTTGLVSRSVAMEARDLLADFDMQVSLKAYTTHPSKTRYQQAMESMSGGMIAMIAAAAAAVIAIVYKVLKMVFGNSDPVTAAAVGKLSDVKNPTTADIKAVVDAVPEPEETVQAQQEVVSVTEELTQEVIETVFEGIPELLDKAFRANEITYVAFENGNTDRVHHVKNVDEYKKTFFAYLQAVEPMIVGGQEWPFRSAAFAMAGTGDSEVAHAMDAIAAEVSSRKQQIVKWASEVTQFVSSYGPNKATSEAEILAFRAKNAEYSKRVNEPLQIKNVNTVSGGSIQTLAASVKAYMDGIVSKHRRLSVHNLNDLLHFFKDNPLHGEKAPRMLGTLLKNRKLWLKQLVEISQAADDISTRLNEVRLPNEAGAIDPQLSRDISGAISDIKNTQQGLTMTIAAIEHEVTLYENDYATMVRVLSTSLAFVSGLNVGYAEDVKGKPESATNIVALNELVTKLKEQGADIVKACDGLNDRALKTRNKLRQFATNVNNLHILRAR